MKKISIFLLFMVIAMIIPVVDAAGADYAFVSATLLNQDPDPAQPGQYVELRWKVVKRGALEIPEAKFELKVEYPFTFDASDTPIKEAGQWNGVSGDDEFFTLYYKLRVDEDAIEDTYKLNLRHTTDGFSWQTQEYDVRVGDTQKAKFVLGNLVTSPTKLVGDTDEASMTLEVNNIGDGDAEHVQVELQLPEGFSPTYTNSERANLGTVEAGSSDSATFYIDIDEGVSAGNVEAILLIKYQESDEEDNEYKSVSLPLSIPIKSRPVFEIERITTTPEQIHAGSNVEMRLLVKNVGGKEADSVSLRAFKESSQPFDFVEKTDFIGKLEVGSDGEAILKLEVDDTAQPKKYLVDIEIRYVDGNEVIVQEKTIPFEILNGANEADKNGSGLTPTTGIIFVIAIVVVGVIAFYTGKNKGKRK